MIGPRISSTRPSTASPSVRKSTIPLPLTLPPFTAVPAKRAICRRDPRNRPRSVMSRMSVPDSELRNCSVSPEIEPRTVGSCKVPLASAAIAIGPVMSKVSSAASRHKLSAAPR